MSNLGRVEHRTMQCSASLLIVALSAVPAACGSRFAAEQTRHGAWP